MAFENPGAEALNYEPCRYGKSRLLFRGPPRRLEGAYVAALGGCETYGKFVPEPWSKLLEDRVGLPVVNLGVANAGLDVFLNDPVVIRACERARATVIQLMPPQNLSNRFYAVHPRRNDRFLRASPLMQSLFREVDFSDFHFTGHMLCTIRDSAPAKFEMIEQELKSAWVARMRLLLDRLGGQRLLLWLEEPASDRLQLIDEEMVMEVRPRATDLVKLQVARAGDPQHATGMIYAPLDEPVALRMLTPASHLDIAGALEPVIQRYL